MTNKSEKLSERLRKTIPAEDLTTYLELLGMCKEVEKLEADSQMLDDLIEMMSEENSYFHLTNIGNVESFVVLAVVDSNGRWTVDDIANGSTPREAVAAAIKTWKEGK